MPKISVIIPVYNSEKSLHRCINSVLCQSFLDFEIILINDGSQDTSGSLCDEYANKDSRIRVSHKLNEGVSVARNLGLDIAKGEWVIFLDSDDWIDNHMLEDMYNKGISECADLVYGDMKVFYKDHIDVLHIAKYANDKEQTLNNFIKSSFSTVVGMLSRKSIYDENNIRFPVGIGYCEDFYVAVRLMLHSKVISYISTPFYCYNRQNEASASFNFSSKHYSNVQWVFSDTIDMFKIKGEYDKYAEALSWRLLNSEKELVLDRETYSIFLTTHPDSHKYIGSCPYLNFKTKIMMWSLSHRLRFIAEFLLLIRNMKLRFVNTFGSDN